MSYFETQKVMYVVAHPDDAEVLFGHAIAATREPHVVVASNGEASAVNRLSRYFCTGWTAAR